MSEDIFAPSDEENTATVDDADTTEQIEDPADSPEPKQNPLEEAQRLLAEAEDRHLRLLAEFDNYRKRTQKEKQQAFKESEAELIKKLLPVIDNFERAIEAPCTDEAYAKGVGMIHSALVEVLAGYGLEKFGTVGEQFDPSLHNAVAHIDDDSLEKNVVSQVFQPGYRIGTRVIRYAMVQAAN